MILYKLETNDILATNIILCLDYQNIQEITLLLLALKWVGKHLGTIQMKINRMVSPNHEKYFHYFFCILFGKSGCTSDVAV